MLAVTGKDKLILKTLFSGMELQNPGDTNDLMKLAEEGGAAKDYKEGDGDEISIKVTLYENGFIVEDGPFRDYEAPANKEFMTSLKASKIPKEIMDKHNPGGRKRVLIGFALSDKRSERSEPPPPPKYTAFSGSGVSMGGAPAQVEEKPVVINVAEAGGKPKLDPSKPTTEIRFRFHNGQQATLEVNLSATVAQLRAYVDSVAPVANYNLVTGFPPKPLTDNSKTVEAAGLTKASIIQRTS